jgi:flagellar biosynthesis/type III secretory pathway chaperone
MTTLANRDFQRSLASLLREELGFYRSLYVLLDRQRDWLKYERDSRILDIFEDVEKLKKRIQESHDKILQTKQHNAQGFEQALTAPDIARLVDNIVSLINKCVELAGENETIAVAKRDRLKTELSELADGGRFYTALQTKAAPRFVDQKR